MSCHVINSANEGILIAVMQVFLNGAEFITRYAGRIKQVHFKDIRIADDIKTTVPLGTGVIDLKSAYEAAKAANVEWIIYEQDNSEDPFADAAKSLEYLKSL